MDEDPSSYINFNEKQTITTKGKTAHASQPWKGINAINKMMEIIQAFYRLPVDQNWETTRNHPILGPPTINVSVKDLNANSDVELSISLGLTVEERYLFSLSTTPLLGQGKT